MDLSGRGFDWTIVSMRLPAGQTWGDMASKRVVWHVVKQYAKTVGLAQVAPHDLRRSCATLYHPCGGELEHIRFLRGHASFQTTE
ncbi:tyrosine-type recombinase/integrase [Occallatibacter riparius]|uniref:tyrosine-type recombinase/integrase n=1 Tax=Occallatibacter riparius TaxID=1002689 RepID=UPI0036F25674